MQCIQDYHPGFERDFNSIDGQTFSYITGLYASLTTRETNIFICRSLPGGRQLNGRTLNQAEYYSDDEQLQDNQRFPVESELGAVISNWIQFYVQDYHSNIDNGPAIQNLEQVYSPEYQFNPALRYHLDRWTSGAIFGFRDSSVFKSYRIMKVFIIQHAMSLGSRGRRSRDRWRLAAAQSMAELDLHRFFACEAIKLSLFQRRQKPIRMDEDNDYARRVLNEVQTWSMWEHHITPNRFTPRLADRLTNLRDPTWFPHPATFRFPSTLSLYNIVSVNFQIYVNDAVSYVNHLQNQQRSRFGAAYASLIKLLIRYIWGIVQNPLRFFPLYNGNVDRLIASDRMGIYMVERPTSSRECRPRHQRRGIALGSSILDNVKLDICWDFFLFDIDFFAFYRVNVVTLDMESQSHIITSDLCEL
jgi:hypothetical protein